MTLRTFVRRVAAFVLAAGAAITVLGCDEGAPVTPAGRDPAPPPGIDPRGTEVGSVALDLQLGTSVQIPTVAYDLSGGSLHRSGTIDVTNSSGASVLLDGIPFGTGYVAAMTASSTSLPRVDCTGSATFSVTAAEVTAVPVHLACREVPPQQVAAAPIPRSAVVVLAFLLLAFGVGLLGGGALSREREEGRP